MSPRSHHAIRVALVVALTIGGGIILTAQSNWPSARTAAEVSKPVKSRTSAPVRRRRAARPRPAAPMRETELLRSMAELATRQAAAIELLARRLEAAEARLSALASSEPVARPMAIDDAQAPFRAAVSIDWDQVIGLP